MTLQQIENIRALRKLAAKYTREARKCNRRAYTILKGC